MKTGNMDKFLSLDLYGIQNISSSEKESSKKQVSQVLKYMIS